jgi:putative ABC transport system permease protein
MTMLKHDLTIVLRRIARRRFHTAVGVLVLTLGLVCFIAANLFVSYMRNHDRHWPNAERIYVVAERLRAADYGVTPSFDTGSDAPIADLLRVEAPELPAVARLYPAQQLFAMEGRRLQFAVAYVEPEFTEIFQLTALAGDSRQALGTPSSAIVTQRGAERLFGATDVVGRTLTLAGPRPVDVTVRAVIADFPQQSHLRWGGMFSVGPDVFLSWDVMQSFPQSVALNWGSRVLKTYVLLPAAGELSKIQLDRRLATIAAERVPTEWRFLNIELQSRPVSAVTTLAVQTWFQGQWGGNVWVDVLAALRVAAATILVIACLNFLNLAVAEGTGRALDVSTRRVLGAKTSQIVRQDLLHTAVLVVFALAIALSAVVPLAKLLAAPWSLSLEIPWSEPRLFAFLGATLCGVKAAAGLYPALVAARARRAAAASVHGAGDALARIRTALVGLQFAAASALVVGAIVLLMQRNELHEALVGRFPDQYLSIFLPFSGPAARDVLANEVERGPGIVGTTGTNYPPFVSAPRRFSRARDDAVPGVMIDWVHTGEEYFDVMDVPLVAGRTFAFDRADEVPRTGEEWTARGGNPASIVLDRAAARALGWPEASAAVGELVYGPGGGPHQIVGVVESVPTSIRDGDTSGAAYVFSPSSGNVLIVRIASDRVEAALAHIDATLTSVYPGQRPNRAFFDQLFEGNYQTFEIINRVLMGLAAFALLISGIGLFGLASYLASRRTREIGIRKVQGATPAGILRLLLWDFSKPVVWANLAAWPLVLIALDRYLSVFAERVALTPLPFALALAATWALACLAVGACAWRAAKLHPAEALRN